MPKTRPLPEQVYLRQRFDYDPVTGILTWRKRPITHFPDERASKIWNTKNAGKRAGSLRHGTVSIEDHPRFIHRVIWKWMTSREPPDQIDHRDQDYLNNRWKNLRAASHSQNQRNRGMQSNNRLGIKGVSWDKRRNKFYARATVNGIPTNLGSFETAQEAHDAYCAAAKEHYGDFWSPGSSTAKRRRIMARAGWPSATHQLPEALLPARR